tara:strand:- start:24 stop:419 length:396 start_codon:yes stop_codon:yes gene_type:complete
MSRKTILTIAFTADLVLWLALGFILSFSFNAYGVTMSNNQLTNDEVIQNWLNGVQGKSSTKNLSTDGQRLYSYRLCIGDTYGNDKIAVNYTASVGEFRSQTTSQHVGLAKRQADQIMHPEVYETTEALRGF